MQSFNDWMEGKQNKETLNQKIAKHDDYIKMLEKGLERSKKSDDNSKIAQMEIDAYEKMLGDARRRRATDASKLFGN